MEPDESAAPSQLASEPDDRPSPGFVLPPEPLDRRLATVSTVGRALVTTLDLDELYWVIYRQIARNLLGAQRLTVFLCDHDAVSVRRVFAVSNGEPDASPPDLPVPLADSPLAEALRAQCPLLVNPSLNDRPQESDVRTGREPRSVLYLPLHDGEATVGVLCAERDGADAFGSVDMAVLWALAEQAAIAIRNANLFTVERDQRDLAEAFRDTAAACNSTLNFDEVLDRILQNVGRVVPHDFADIMLVEGGVARIARRSGVSDTGLEAQILARRFAVADVPNLRQMAASGQSLAVADTRRYAGWTDFVENVHVRSYAGTPIRLRGLLVGFLNLYSATPDFFTAGRAERLQVFADQVAVAIENASLYGTVERQTIDLEQRVFDRTRELAEANAQLKELDGLKDQFISNVSHELRTPLANIKLYLGLLEHGRQEKRAQYMQTLLRETARLGGLIEDLLELSRLDMGSARIHLEPTDLNALAAELIGDRSAMAAARGLALDCQLDPNVAPALGDPKRVTQVMTNLVANAIHYTPSGGIITLETSLRRWDERDWVTFTVQDTGRGISPDELPKLFTRFFRGEAGRQSQASGTGLGLAICHELVEKMHGRITVESEVGRGSTFTVWLQPAGKRTRIRL